MAGTRGEGGAAACLCSSVRGARPLACAHLAFTPALPWPLRFAFVLQPDEVEERHRRDGFETASADRIFESTTLAAKPDTV